MCATPWGASPHSGGVDCATDGCSALDRWRLGALHELDHFPEVLPVPGQALLEVRARQLLERPVHREVDDDRRHGGAVFPVPDLDGGEVLDLVEGGAIFASLLVVADAGHGEDAG